MVPERGLLGGGFDGALTARSGNAIVQAERVRPFKEGLCNARPLDSA